MSSSGFQRAPGWYWPDDIPKEEQSTATPASSSSSSRAQPGSTPKEAPRRRKYWPPRDCRICFETVQPTYHAPPENLPGFLQSSTPKVTYEDGSGRLIRPCLCKGSSKYVHEGCLQAWRHADPGYGRRNYWQCPTCGFKYQLARLGWGRWVASRSAQIVMTVAILFITVFLLGFVADPIINLYVDPWSFLPWASSEPYFYDEETATWSEHFAKGLAGMGVLGFLKVIAASPFQIFRFGGRRGRVTGRDRVEQVSWVVILVGVFTFMGVIYKGVRAWSRRMLEKAGERVMDVQQEDDDDEDPATR